MKRYKLKKTYTPSQGFTFDANTELHYSAGYYWLPGGFCFKPEFVEANKELFEEITPLTP